MRSDPGAEFDLRAQPVRPELHDRRLIVALMITPIITSITREVFATVPRNDKDGALALGATRWEMIKGVVLPALERRHHGRGDARPGPGDGRDHRGRAGHRREPADRRRTSSAPGEAMPVGDRPQPQRVVGRLPGGAHRPRRACSSCITIGDQRRRPGRLVVALRSPTEGGLMSIDRRRRPTVAACPALSSTCRPARSPVDGGTGTGWRQREWSLPSSSPSLPLAAGDLRGRSEGPGRRAARTGSPTTSPPTSRRLRRSPAKFGGHRRRSVGLPGCGPPSSARCSSPALAQR